MLDASISIAASESMKSDLSSESLSYNSDKGIGCSGSGNGDSAGTSVENRSLNSAVTAYAESVP